LLQRLKLLLEELQPLLDLFRSDVARIAGHLALLERLNLQLQRLYLLLELHALGRVRVWRGCRGARSAGGRRLRECQRRQ
jgi:hypothetical protein